MWKILYLPAINEQGEALWPEYFSLEKLAQIKRQMGSALFQAMYQGNPSALSGEVFKPGWLKKARLVAGENDISIRIDDDLLPLDEFVIIQAWDLAISQKETADYSVCLTLGMHSQTRRLVILAVNRARRTFDDIQRTLEREGQFWNPYTIGLEKVAFQSAAAQEAIRRTLLPVREYRPDHDKVTRARLPAALAEAGKLYYVEADWNEIFLDEMLEFPNGRHDDQVDALSLATSIAMTFVESSFYLWGED